MVPRILNVQWSSGTRKKGFDGPALCYTACRRARDLCTDLRARLRAELDKFINQRTTIKGKESKVLSRPKHIQRLTYVGLEATLRQAPTSGRIERLEISGRGIFERIRAVRG